MDQISPKQRPFRQAILEIEPNGIGRVASLALGEPDLLPLWFGETDLVTPDFICAAAKRALDEGSYSIPMPAGSRRCEKESGISIGERLRPMFRWTGSLYRARQCSPSSSRCNA